jgi:hypothetical protein
MDPAFSHSTEVAMKNAKLTITSARLILEQKIPRTLSFPVLKIFRGIRIIVPIVNEPYGILIQIKFNKAFKVKVKADLIYLEGTDCLSVQDAESYNLTPITQDAYDFATRVARVFQLTGTKTLEEGFYLSNVVDSPAPEARLAAWLIAIHGDEYGL